MLSHCKRRNHLISRTCRHHITYAIPLGIFVLHLRGQIMNAARAIHDAEAKAAEAVSDQGASTSAGLEIAAATERAWKMAFVEVGPEPKQPTEVEKCVRLLDSAKKLGNAESIALAERKLRAARDARDPSKPSSVKFKNTLEAVQKAERAVEAARAERKVADENMEAARQRIAEADDALQAAEKLLAERQAASAKAAQEEANNLAKAGSIGLPPELLPNAADDERMAAQRAAAAEHMQKLHEMLKAPQQPVVPPAAGHTPNVPVEGDDVADADMLVGDDVESIDLSKYDLGMEADESKREASILEFLKDAHDAKRQRSKPSQGG